MSRAGGLIRILEVSWLDLLVGRLAAVVFCGAQGSAGLADTGFPEFEQLQSRGQEDFRSGRLWFRLQYLGATCSRTSGSNLPLHPANKGFGWRSAVPLLFASVRSKWISNPVAQYRSGHSLTLGGR
jgi:hypothetical protein